MNLTENQIKRIKPLLTKLVNEVKTELREEPMTPPTDGTTGIKLSRPQQPFPIGMNKVQFLPSGGMAIRTTKATLTLSDDEAKKLASMIVRIIGK